ncbi:MAG: hypothetical protein ACP5EN_16995 [Rhodovulum sp.]
MTKNPVFIALASLALSGAAQAATVSLPQVSGGVLTAEVTEIDADAWGVVDPTQGRALPDGAAWAAGSEIADLPSAVYPVDPALVADPCQFACSPFYGGIYGQFGDYTGNSADGWETAPFWTVFQPEDGSSSATLEFTGLQSSVSLLWGSPDAENWIELLIGDETVAGFWGSDFDWLYGELGEIVRNPGQGAAYLTLSGIDFDALRFTTYADKGSFEFSNITTTPVPLPGTALLLAGALGAMGTVRRLRNARG